MKACPRATRKTVLGQRPKKTTHPNKNNLCKQFAQTLLLFCLFYREQGDSLYKLFRNCLGKLCFYLGGWFFGVGLPFMKNGCNHRAWNFPRNVIRIHTNSRNPLGGVQAVKKSPKTANQNAFETITLQFMLRSLVTSLRTPPGCPQKKCNRSTLAWCAPMCPTVPEGHKHRVTTPEKPRKIPRTPAESAEPRRALGETPAEPSERPPLSTLRGKFPRRASRRVVPLGW